MIQSLAMKAGMLLATVLLVTWIGWPTPHEPIPVGDVASAEGEAPQAVLPREEPMIIARPATRPAAPTPTAGRSQEKQGKLDLNRATAEELQGLPGIGPVLAQRVIAQRTTHGPFHTVDDLRDVKGIGKKRMDQLRPLVMVNVAVKTEPIGKAKFKTKAL
jgi:competence protein ComEA